MLFECSETVSHLRLVTFEFSCFCCYSLLKFFSYCLNPLALMLYYLLSSSFVLFLIFFRQFDSDLSENSNIIFNCPYTVWFFKLFLLAITPTLLDTNPDPALKRLFSSSKVLTQILQIISLTSEAVLLTFKESIPCSEVCDDYCFPAAFFIFSDYHHFHVTHQFPPYQH